MKRSRFSCFRFKNQFNTQKKSLSAHISNQGKRFFQCFKILFQPVSCFQSILPEPFLFHYIQNSHTHRAGNMVSSESIEIFHAVGEFFCYFPRSNYSPQGVSITDWLTETDYVRYHVLQFKRPEMFPYTSKTYLNFIGYAQSSVLPHILVGLLQKTLR